MIGTVSAMAPRDRRVQLAVILGHANHEQRFTKLALQVDEDGNFSAAW